MSTLNQPAVLAVGVSVCVDPNRADDIAVGGIAEVQAMGRGHAAIQKSLLHRDGLNRPDIAAANDRAASAKLVGISAESRIGRSYRRAASAQFKVFGRAGRFLEHGVAAEQWRAGAVFDQIAIILLQAGAIRSFDPLAANDAVAQGRYCWGIPSCLEANLPAV